MVLASVATDLHQLGQALSADLIGWGTAVIWCGINRDGGGVDYSSRSDLAIGPSMTRIIRSVTRSEYAFGSMPWAKSLVLILSRQSKGSCNLSGMRAPFSAKEGRV